MSDPSENMLGGQCESCNGISGNHASHCPVGYRERVRVEAALGTAGTAETIANYNARIIKERLAAGFSAKDSIRGLQDAPPGDVAALPTDAEIERMWRTHHQVGSAEETYSRRMRFDKYLAMQRLLMEISAAAPEDNHAMQCQARAREILAGMVRPRGPAVRSADRAAELEVLALAYRLASGVAQPSQQNTLEARSLMVEALKAWERNHPPAPLDPLLGP